ncbi:MAG TPA: protease HtpX [Leptospiraceae bacterium]|nr:protease HtpX [Leptospiraceae bacterium]HMW03882.1 protease HtpX [Leptospiraceae bacterium]HMX32404.1 protease HtpX [Leptospiraceae bacterium]HMY29862.1 protease HtpX [Leptospiraceae bacterium]HMZ62994.1 protease HtpX [Leptospiraceae bacterium]
MWFKRIGLFFLINILIMVTISIITSVLGVRGYISNSGLNMTALLTLCLIWGMTGSLISLALSKVMAKWMMGVETIDPRGPYGHLYASVQRLSQAARIPMPEVGIYNSPEVNAFATGPSQSSALVAVSTGLLERMNTTEVDGVLAHEVSHIANGDMVTMTLIQGVVNAFTMFLARIISYGVTMAISRNDDDGPSVFSSGIYFIITLVLDILFSILGSLVVAYFSRQREFRADAGGAKLAGRASMIAALENLQRTYEVVDDSRAPSMASLKISSHKGGWFALFSTHPPLEDRIAALKNAR